ncbi:hypothetical protein [Bacillus nakamurai]|uniref:hypothetical protein n=1 Tax=Bacillus nakamurai TaxID=1793963 RepID=UPI001E4EFBB6|nr:hypothetical protein [Bacillus nakamurai]MCC9021537.1 hypothetical protein [Bacillus nakamurai]
MAVMMLSVKVCPRPFLARTAKMDREYFEVNDCLKFKINDSVRAIDYPGLKTQEIFEFYNIKDKEGNYTTCNELYNKKVINLTKGG